MDDKAVLEIQTDLRQIKACLIGDEYTRDTSVLAQMAELKKDVHMLKEFKNRFTWTLGLIVSCGSVAGMFVGALINKILHLV